MENEEEKVEKDAVPAPAGIHKMLQGDSLTVYSNQPPAPPEGTYRPEPPPRPYVPYVPSPPPPPPPRIPASNPNAAAAISQAARMEHWDAAPRADDGLRGGVLSTQDLLRQLQAQRVTLEQFDPTRLLQVPTVSGDGAAQQSLRCPACNGTHAEGQDCIDE